MHYRNFDCNSRLLAFVFKLSADHHHHQSPAIFSPTLPPTAFEPNLIYATGTLVVDAFRNSSQSQHPSRTFDNPQQ